VIQVDRDNNFVADTRNILTATRNMFPWCKRGLTEKHVTNQVKSMTSVRSRIVGDVSNAEQFLTFTISG